MLSICKKCHKIWYYSVERCIYCKGKTTKKTPRNYSVKGWTQVCIPSKDHPEVPYYDLLLEDNQGNFYIRKSFKKFHIGDQFTTQKATIFQPKKVGIIGTGTTGVGISQVVLKAGHKVILKSRGCKALTRAIRTIANNLQKNFPVEEKKRLMKNLLPTIKIDNLKNADIVIESIIEDLKVKKQVFKKLDLICSKKTILATNTSSLSISEMAAATHRPQKTVGLHFFNPIPKMELVEVIKGKLTSKETIEFAVNFIKDLKKTPIVIKDSPCFIVNKILMPYLNEAVFLLNDGIAKVEDIDNSIKLALHHPMGPFELIDLIGLDVWQKIMNNLYKQTKSDKFKPCPLIQKMVNKGRLGRKAGWGFYKY